MNPSLKAVLVATDESKSRKYEDQSGFGIEEVVEIENDLVNEVTINQYTE